MTPILKIGENDDVGNFGNSLQRFARAGNKRLPIHFGAKKSLKQGPDILRGYQIAGCAPRERGFECTAYGPKVDIVRFVQPGAEMPHHVQQHLVAIGDEQGAAHASSSSRA